jgi:hypothetical protein
VPPPQARDLTEDHLQVMAQRSFGRVWIAVGNSRENLAMLFDHPQ